MKHAEGSRLKVQKRECRRTSNLAVRLLSVTSFTTLVTGSNVTIVTYLLTILCKYVKEDGFIFHFCKYWDNRTLLVCRTSAVQAYRCSSIIRMMDRWMVIVRGNKRERLLKMYKSYS